MRRIAKVDDNQAEVVKALRAIGCSVLHLHRVGDGAPDLCVGLRGFNVLLEIKDGSKPPSARVLTKDEITFRSGWRGQYAVVESPEQAIKVVQTHT